jgi:hypothetical protein
VDVAVERHDAVAGQRIGGDRRGALGLRLVDEDLAVVGVDDADVVEGGIVVVDLELLPGDRADHARRVLALRLRDDDRIGGGRALRRERAVLDSHVDALHLVLVVDDQARLARLPGAVLVVGLVLGHALGRQRRGHHARDRAGLLRLLLAGGGRGGDEQDRQERQGAMHPGESNPRTRDVER